MRCFVMFVTAVCVLSKKVLSMLGTRSRKKKKAISFYGNDSEKIPEHAQSQSEVERD